MTTENDYLMSSLREKYYLHLFLSDIYSICLTDKVFENVQILIPELDSNGADIVIVHNFKTCFIQLKSITDVCNRASPLFH